MLVPTMLAPLQCAGNGSEQNSLASSLVTIAQRNFLPNQTMLISSTGHDDVTVGLLLGLMSVMSMWSVRVVRPDMAPVETTHEDYNTIGSYVLFVRDPEELEKHKEELTYRMAWSSRARFLVVVTERVDSPALLALDIVQEMWKSARVLQVVVMVQNQLYTWFPYQQCSTRKEIVRLGERSILFPDKTLHRQHGCELIVGTTPVLAHVMEDDNNSFWGLEIEYLHLLQRALNFTVSYRIPGPGNSHDRHFELVQDLHMGLADMVIGNFPLHLFIAQLADPTIPYLESSLKWFVPCARPASRMKNVMRLYTTSVWVAVGGVMLLATVCTWLLGRRVQHPPSLPSVLHDVWALTLGVSLPQLPRDWRRRALFALLIWYCLAMSTVSQTIFTSVLVDPGLNKQIRTFEELQESGLKYCIYPDIERFINASGPYLENIRLHKEKNLDLTECIRRVLLEDDMTTVTFTYLIEYFALAELGTRSKICSLDENVFQFSYTMYVIKGSSLLDKFNRVISHMLEAGVMQRLWLDVKETMRQNGLREASADEAYFILGLSHLQLVFYMLVMGNAASFVVFVVELLSGCVTLRSALWRAPDRFKLH